MLKKCIWIPAALALVALGIAAFLLISGEVTGNAGAILCLGDSLTESRYGSYPPYLAHYAQKYGYRLRVSLQAHPGYTSGEFLAALEKNGMPGDGTPDIVILMLGTNDVRRDHDHTPTGVFRRNLAAICDRIRAGTQSLSGPPRLVLLTIPPIIPEPGGPFDRNSIRQARDEVVPAIRQLAYRKKALLIDIFSFFTRRPDLLPGIHPTSEGYREMAAFIFQSLKPAIDPYRINPDTGSGRQE